MECLLGVGWFTTCSGGCKNRFRGSWGQGGRKIRLAGHYDGEQRSGVEISSDWFPDFIWGSSWLCAPEILYYSITPFWTEIGSLEGCWNFPVILENKMMPSQSLVVLTLLHQTDYVVYLCVAGTELHKEAWEPCCKEVLEVCLLVKLWWPALWEQQLRVASQVGVCC